MAGTKKGGLKAAQTNRTKYGEDFYSDIGRKGGRNGHTGGFASNPALAKLAGSKGGARSRRGPKFSIEEIKKALQDFKTCGDAKAAALRAGVTKQTIYRWYSKYN